MTNETIIKLQEVQERIMFVADGLRGIGIATSSNDFHGDCLEWLGHGVLAMGQYLQDLNTDLAKEIDALPREVKK
tara:strand:- start:37847 stop:38071 length:225 start_codon:yes stop_codon:yes gene_type:complete